MTTKAATQHEQQADWLQTKFEILALGKGDRQAALDCARAFVSQVSHNAQALNRFAWDLLTEDDYSGRFDDLALTVAEKACERSDYRNWAILDTLALAKFRAGEVDSAIALQEKAINLYGGHDDNLVAALDRYRAAKHGQ